jgi:hypothetical protein
MEPAINGTTTEAPAPPPFADFGYLLDEAEGAPPAAPVPAPPQPAAAAPVAVAAPIAPAPAPVAPPPAPLAAPSGPPPGMSAYEYLRQLESELSSLMDDHDTPDWKVNPAYHPDVIAYIRNHAGNSAFTQKAEALQKNRAKFYATIRQQAAAAAAIQAAAPASTATVSPAAEVKPKPRSVRRFVRRVAIGSFLMVLLAAIVGGSVLFIRQQMAADQLQTIVGQTDGADPGWKMQDLVSKRPAIADADNSALGVLAAEKELPADWRPDAVFDTLQKLEPYQALSDDDGADLRADLRFVEKAVLAARRLVGLRPGRYPPDPNLSIKIQRLIDLLFLDAAEAADRQDAAAAFASIAAMLGISGSLADEPGLPAQFMRTGIRSVATQSIERVLGQCPHVPAEDLAQLRHLLEEEAERPILLTVLRGERAYEFESYNRKLAGTANGPTPDAGWLENTGKSVDLWASAGWIVENQAADLELMNELVALARLPTDEQYPKFREWQAKVAALNDSFVPGRYGLAADHLGEARRMVEKHFERLAELRCAVVMLALEEYRTTKGDWPPSLEALVPDYLAKVPLSPFDGKPLRLHRIDGGWSVSTSDATDGSGIGFRIGDEGRRREPFVR